MTTDARVSVGDRWSVQCHLANGDTVTRTVVTTTATVNKVVQLGCGCQRLSVDRPGANADAWCRTMDVRTGCAWHTPQGVPTDQETAS